jgi:hypothetical protein
VSRFSFASRNGTIQPMVGDIRGFHEQHISNRREDVSIKQVMLSLGRIMKRSLLNVDAWVQNDPL